MFHKCHLRFEKKGWMVGGIAKAGVWFNGTDTHVYDDGTRSVTSSSCQTYSHDVEKEFHHLMDGGFFVDMRHCTMNNVIDHALRGPMLDLEKPSDYLERDPPGSLNYVGLSYYLNHAQDHGAKIGMRRGNTIYWSDDTTTEIPACDCWIRVCCACNAWRSYCDPDPKDRNTWGERKGRIPSDPNDHCPGCKERFAAERKCPADDNLLASDCPWCSPDRFCSACGNLKSPNCYEEGG